MAVLKRFLNRPVFVLGLAAIGLFTGLYRECRNLYRDGHALVGCVRPAWRQAGDREAGLDWPRCREKPEGFRTHSERRNS